MNKSKVIRAVAAAGAVSVVPLAFAGTAQASTQSSPDHGHGWVRVCHKIYDYDHHYGYWGDYSIRDSKHRRWDFSLGGRSYDCFTTKVKTGWTKVSVDAMRCTGASSQAKQSFAIAAAISAPYPHESESSYATITREVFFTDA